MIDKKKIKDAVAKLKPKDPRVLAIRAMIALAKSQKNPGPAGVDGAAGRDGVDGAAGRDGVDGRDGQKGLDGVAGARGEVGEKGEIGLRGERGEAGMIWRGTYRSDTQYEIGDVVGVSGSAYICVASTNQSPPTGYGWELLVSRGAQGVRGIKGEDGTGADEVSAGKLTGDTLAENVLYSSLTSVGTLEFLSVTNAIAGSITGNAATATSANSALTATTATTATSALTAATVTTAAQPAITSVGTLTSLTINAGTSSVAPLKLTSGTNLTTASSGAVEFDGKVVYATTATGRGVVPSVQMIVPSSVNSLTNTGGATQDIFSSSQNSVTLQSNTTYMFDSIVYVTEGTTSHSTAYGLTLDGGATASSFVLRSTGFAGASFGAAVTAQITVVSDDPSTTGWVGNSASTSPSRCVKFEGVIRVVDGGTMTPQLVFSVSPGGTNQVEVGTFFRIYAIGTDTMQTVGAIS